MYKKIGLLILYVLLIGSALNTSFRAPVENPLILAVIGLAVLVVMMFFIIRSRHRNH